MHPGGSSDKKGKSQIEKIVIEYHPEAADEFIEAAQFYESREKGLGEQFIHSIESSLNFIKQNPRIGQGDQMGRRKYVVKKFPYLLIYKVKENRIYILAVAHASRRPNYWEQRSLEILSDY